MSGHMYSTVQYCAFAVRQSIGSLCCGRTHTGIICSVIDDRRKEQSVGVSLRPTRGESSKAGTARRGTYLLRNSI